MKVGVRVRVINRTKHALNVTVVAPRDGDPSGTLDLEIDEDTRWLDTPTSRVVVPSVAVMFDESRAAPRLPLGHGFEAETPVRLGQPWVCKRCKAEHPTGAVMESSRRADEDTTKLRCHSCEMWSPAH